MVLTSKWGRIQPEIQIWHVQVTWRCVAVRELPKDVLKMASGLISPSGLAGHRRQLCSVPGAEDMAMTKLVRPHHAHTLSLSHTFYWASGSGSYRARHTHHLSAWPPAGTWSLPATGLSSPWSQSPTSAPPPPTLRPRSPPTAPLNIGCGPTVVEGIFPSWKWIRSTKTLYLDWNLFILY